MEKDTRYNFIEALRITSYTIKKWIDAQGFVKDTGNNKNLFGLKDIPAGVTSANELIDPGYYYVGTGTIALSDLPQGFYAGLIIVFNDPAVSTQMRNYQIVISYNTNKIYTRTLKVGQELQNWELLVDDTNNNDSVLLESADLNNIVQAGAYAISSNPEIIYENLPTRCIAGLLMVHNGPANSALATRLYQIFIDYATLDIYTRNRYVDGSFSEWRNQSLDKNILNLKADDNDVMKISEFLQPASSIDPASMNIFDGNFIQGYQFASPTTVNPPVHYLRANPIFTSLAQISVKPNTTYTVLVSMVTPELDAASGNHYYYFKVGLATHNLIIDTDKTFDGRVFLHTNIKENDDDAIMRFSFTTTENEKYLYVQACRAEENRPHLQVIEGYVSEDELRKANESANYGSVQYEFTDKIAFNPSKVLDIEKVTADIVDKAEQELKENITIAESLDIDNIILADNTNYIPGYQMTGNNTESNPLKLTKSSQFNSLLKVKVEAGKTYTIYRNKAEKELAPNSTTNSYHYGKYAVSPKDIITGNLYDGVDTVLPKQVSGWTGFETSITIPEYDGELWLYVQMARQLQPLCGICEGVLSNPNKLMNNRFYPVLNMYGDKEVLVNTSILNNAIRPSIEKNSELIHIQDGKIDYRIVKTTNSSIRLDTWRWTVMTANDQTIFNAGDYEGVVKEKNAADFIGGWHGDEIIQTTESGEECFDIYVDGCHYTASSIIPLTHFSSLILIAKSTIYKCKDNENGATTPYFNRVKKLAWENNSLTIYNTWEYIGATSIQLDCAYLSGMLSIKKNILNGYTATSNMDENYDEYTSYLNGYITNIYDSANNTYTIAASATSKDNTEFIFYLKDGVLVSFSPDLNDIQEFTGGFTLTSGSGYADRVKAYFETYSNATIEPGQILKGKYTITIKQ